MRKELHRRTALLLVAALTLVLAARVLSSLGDAPSPALPPAAEAPSAAEPVDPLPEPLPGPRDAAGAGGRSAADSAISGEEDAILFRVVPDAPPSAPPTACGLELVLRDGSTLACEPVGEWDAREGQLFARTPEPDEPLASCAASVSLEEATARTVLDVRELAGTGRAGDPYLVPACVPWRAVARLQRVPPATLFPSVPISAREWGLAVTFTDRTAVPGAAFGHLGAGVDAQRTSSTSWTALADDCEPRHAVLTFGALVLASRGLDPAHPEATFDPTARFESGVTGSLVFRVVAEDGASLGSQAFFALAGVGFDDLPSLPVFKVDWGVEKHLDHLPPGVLKLVVRSFAAPPVERLVTIEPGRVTQLGSIVLRPWRPLHGTVFDERGQVLETSVEIVDLATGGVLSRSHYEEDAGGYHLLLWVDEQRSLGLRVLDPGSSRAPIPFDVEDALRAGFLQLVAPAGLQVHLAMGRRGLAGDWLALVSSEGLPVDSFPFEPGEDTGVLLAPGSYEARLLRCSGSVVSTRRFEVRAGGPFVVDLF